MLLLTEGQASDHRGAAIMLPRLMPARELIADRGYDSNPFRGALAERGIDACIPSKKKRKQPIPHNPALSRHRIEILFGRLKDWRRIATRDDQRAHTFLAAITLAATVIFWLGQRTLSLEDISKSFIREGGTQEPPAIDPSTHRNVRDPGGGVSLLYLLTWTNVTT